MKFLLNSTHNVLPTADNLRRWRWGKTAVDMKCNLCSFANATLKHILNCCTAALKQGRYPWRHGSILLCIVKELLPLSLAVQIHALCPTLGMPPFIL